MKSQTFLPFILLVSLLSMLSGQAALTGSATWNANPTSGDWNTAANWTPATVPNGSGDTATFASSDVTAVSVSNSIELDSMRFNSFASAFTITVDEHFGVSLSSEGIVNNSTVQQRFQLSGTSGVFNFTNNATAGRHTLFTTSGGLAGNSMQFINTASANHATIINQSHVDFFDSASAGQGIISTTGGALHFYSNSTAANSTLGIGTDGWTEFRDGSTGGTCRVELFDNAQLIVGFHDAPGLTIGSLEGHGLVILGFKPRFKSNLTVGSNNLAARFSGQIDDVGLGAIVEKTGKGTWFLINSNTYSGGTVVSGGKLIANNRSGSATGSGAVQVNAGALGGKGIVAGPVTVGSAGSAASLSPGAGRPGTLTIQNALTFGANGTCHWRVDSDSERADQVVALGVTIEDGAVFETASRGTASLASGTSFIVINNTDVTSITGTFSNLADGATVTIGSNAFQANYEGGDGNDLTLTVVP